MTADHDGHADRTVHLPVGEPERLHTQVELAQAAERLGYERAWLPETWGRDAPTVLGAVAGATESIGLGTSVLNVYSRSPALIAQTAATLQELSDGRARVGVGPSGPAVIEGWHGAAFERPLRRTRETVEILKRALTGDVVEYDGDCFELSGFRLRQGAPETPPPVDATGMGPKAVELCGRFADGWHAIVQTPAGVRERLSDFRRGAELADRDPASLRVTLSLPCCALADGERARRLAREHVAFYLGAMGTYYRDALARQGHEAVADEVAAAYASGDRERAAAAIPEELLDRLAPAGEPDRVRDLVARFEAVEGLDSVAVAPPRGATAAETERTLEALAP
jgi:coenzyme F420-dependent oxidoreductase